jgi:DNA-binding LacI/PurR family transcriptional regulator
MSKITIKEIAKLAKVSPTAVSFVLNNRKGVSPVTRKRVLKIINSTNFIPNRSSRRLSLKKSFNICLVMNPKSSPFTDLFYFDITRGIVEESSNYDYSLILCQLNTGKITGTIDEDLLIPNSVRNQDTDGIIFLQDTPEGILTRVEELGVPFVLVDAQNNKNHRYITVNPDSERSAYVATEYLIKKGHRDIGFIGSSYLKRYYLQTSNGFKQALRDYDLSTRPSWIFSDAQDELSAGCGMERILKSRKIPSAIFCTGDRFAIGGIKCAQQKGYPVPEKISFIGMDDIILSSHITPPLTTIGFNTVDMGKMAVKLLIKKINGEEVSSYTVPSENIIERASVRSL